MSLAAGCHIAKLACRWMAFRKSVGVMRARAAEETAAAPGGVLMSVWDACNRTSTLNAGQAKQSYSANTGLGCLQQNTGH